MRSKRSIDPTFGVAIGLLSLCVLLMFWHLRVHPVRMPPGGAVAEGVVPLEPRVIDINTATEAELRLIPSIGAVLAERIIVDRNANGPFASLEDLQRISGIGKATIERMRDVAVADN